MDKQYMKAFVNEIETNEDYAFIVLYCFKIGFKQLLSEAENGRADGVIQILKSAVDKMGDEYGHVLYSKLH